jgi:hypothetical protein
MVPRNHIAASTDILNQLLITYKVSVVRISEEIQQQCSLPARERRLDMAKTLRQEVVYLRNSYEVGTPDSIKKLRRRTGV